MQQELLCWASLSIRRRRLPAADAVLVCPRALFLMYSLIARLLSQFHDKRLTDILRGDIPQHMYMLHINGIL